MEESDAARLRLGWSRTERHVSASRAACPKSWCPGGGDNQEHESARSAATTASAAALLICPSLSSSLSSWQAPDDDPTSGCVDCTLYHVHRWLVAEVTGHV